MVPKVNGVINVAKKMSRARRTRVRRFGMLRSTARILPIKNTKVRKTLTRALIGVDKAATRTAAVGVVAGVGYHYGKKNERKKMI